MTFRNRLFTGLTLATCALIVLTGTFSASAGDLNPPFGLVAPTPGPEPRTAINATNTPGDADSLFKITQPGSYYLAGNIQGVAAKHGIEIAAGGVTLDLNGFDLLGVAGSLSGVCTTVANLTNISVRNGSIRAWGSHGLNFNSSTSIGCIIDNVRASGTGNIGIFVGNGSTIMGCTASSNAGFGFYAGVGSSLVGCTASGNNGNGMFGSFGCTFSACTAYGNGADGIATFSGSTISGCTAYSNVLDGIEVGDESRVADNTCDNNGITGDGAGIRATGPGNRIERNNCTDADRGIHVTAAGNIILKNTCSGNTIDWVIVANNVIGPIIDRRAPANAAVNGFTAPSSLGSADSNANFSY